MQERKEQGIAVIGHCASLPTTEGPSYASAKLIPLQQKQEVQVLYANKRQMQEGNCR